MKFIVRAEVILKSETGAVVVEADSREDAHEKGLEALGLKYPDAESIEVFGIIKQKKRDET